MSAETTQPSMPPSRASWPRAVQHSEWQLTTPSKATSQPFTARSPTTSARSNILAAFADGMPVPTDTETGEHWREVIETGLTLTFLTVSAFLPTMIARHSGVIITMSSAAARQAARSSAAYAAAKSGVIAFSRHLAGEFANVGIRVNCLAPSATENDHMRSWVPAKQRKELAGAFPLGRLRQPDDVAAATLFLASSASSWITGVTLDIVGGKIML